MQMYVAYMGRCWATLTKHAEEKGAPPGALGFRAGLLRLSPAAKNTVEFLLGINALVDQKRVHGADCSHKTFLTREDFHSLMDGDVVTCAAGYGSILGMR